MKNNTNETKIFLQKALSQVPQDHALSEIRYHIRVALEKLENVEKKRDRREINLERREIAKNQKSVSTFDPFIAIRAIDEEISKEKIRIENIKQRRSNNKKDDDDDEFQTVFG
jgi:hypothetical protein